MSAVSLPPLPTTPAPAPAGKTADPFSTMPTKPASPTNSAPATTNGTASPTASDPTTNGNASDKMAYNDDDADVKLKSTDGRVFKVHSYLLKAHSTHFRDLLKDGPPTDPFPVPLGTKHLKLLLDLMHMKPAPSGALWAYHVPLLSVADAYALKSVAERITYSMHEVVDKDPWGVFCVASQRGSLALARSALRALAAKEGGVKLVNITPDMAREVAVPYLLGAFAAAVKAAEEGEKGEVVGWKQVADKFSPVVG